MEQEKIQRAIEYLTPISKHPTMTGQYCEHLITAIECMEKQLAKPLLKIYPYGEANEPVEECPVCGNPYANDSYCGTCGQAIDHLHNEA